MVTTTIDLFKHTPDFRTVKAGEVVFNAGDKGDFMYVVQEGTVEIILNGQHIEDIGPGGIFGEMALIDSHPRSASAIAKTDAHIVPIDEKRFNFMVQQTPFFALHVMKITVERLRLRMQRAALG
jgi:CRP-like cAMP-binding protein